MKDNLQDRLNRHIEAMSEGTPELGRIAERMQARVDVMKAFYGLIPDRTAVPVRYNTTRTPSWHRRLVARLGYWLESVAYRLQNWGNR